MATVSILMAMAALAVAVATFVRCQRLAQSISRLPTNIADTDAREQLAALTSELPSLHTRVDHLRQCWQADAGKLEAVVRQLENRTAGLEQDAGTLAAVAGDLESLKDLCRELQSALRQWENRIVELEQGYSKLGTVATDLESLREFRSEAQSVLGRLESRTVELERGHSNLDAVSKDLERLRAFQDHVEHVHAGIQKAFNGKLTESASLLLPDEKTS